MQIFFQSSSAKHEEIRKPAIDLMWSLNTVLGTTASLRYTNGVALIIVQTAYLTLETAPVRGFIIWIRNLFAIR